MADVVVAVPECVKEPSVWVQIHMEDGPEFEALVEGQEVREFENEFGPFRAADVVLACGHKATVYGRARESAPQVVVVVQS